MRTRLKIAYTEKALELFGKVGTREAVLVDHTDFTDVGAILMTGGRQAYSVQPLGEGSPYSHFPDCP